MYSRYSSGGSGLQQFFVRGRIPVTTILLTATVLHFVINFYFGHEIVEWVACVLPSLHPFGSPRIWTLLTYPIAQTDVLGTLFLGFWLWWVGGSLERAWGSEGFAKFLFVQTIGTSLMLLFGSHVVGEPFIIAGLALPVVGMTAAWAAINPYEEILFWMVIRMQAWVLAVGIIALMLFVDFASAPFLGLFALVNPLIGYIWVRGIRLGPSTGVFRSPRTAARRGPDLRLVDTDRPKRKQPLDDLRGTSRRGPIGAFQDWRQRRRLEKLWKASGLTDDDDDPKRRG
ncbi:MAG: rhomboid family intramembrane serine protease [Capsulimonadaceae bacterium]|nr:rhomboid family intramembrane serine protease [Capsulimonadaceae bacterium]